MSITFSIIIPTYNRGHMIAETIGSVKAQTFADWECIVVDDGSTDNTKEVVTNISKLDPRVRYVYQQNAERSVARNLGINQANGDYVCFLDSDDQYCKDYLLLLHNFLEMKQFPNGMVISDFFVWTETGIEPANTPPPKEPIADWIFRYPATPSRVCVSRKALAEFQFDEEILIVEDSVLWTSISTKYPVVFLTKPLVKYRVHEQNSVDRSTKAAFHRYKGLKKFFKSRFSEGVSENLKQELISDVRWRMAEYYGLHQHHFRSISIAIHSIFTMPKHRHTRAKLFLIWQNIGCLLGLRSSISI